jgi:hypothetical protein
MLCRGVFVCVYTLVCMRTSAQSVISTHSGLVHFSEGTVSIDGRTVFPINGRFPEIREGSLLDTNEGKVEILLAPEVFLWLSQNSKICMQRNSLADTRVELLEGSAVVQSTELLPDNRVTLVYKGSQVLLSAHTLYRIDAPSSQLTVLMGEATVTQGADSLVVSEPARFAMSTGQFTVLPKSEPDGFDQWTLERRRVIASARLNRGLETRTDLADKNNRRRSHSYRAVFVPIPRRTW